MEGDAQNNLEKMPLKFVGSCAKHVPDAPRMHLQPPFVSKSTSTWAPTLVIIYILDLDPRYCLGLIVYRRSNKCGNISYVPLSGLYYKNTVHCIYIYRFPMKLQ